jgi:hypothetical protein
MAWRDTLRKCRIVTTESNDDLGEIREQPQRLFLRRGGSDVDVARRRGNQ